MKAKSEAVKEIPLKGGESEDFDPFKAAEAN
jgi:hypothetical protein